MPDDTPLRQLPSGNGIAGSTEATPVRPMQSPTPGTPRVQKQSPVLHPEPSSDIEDAEASPDDKAAASDASLAIDAILEPLSRGEGFRHGWLGDTRMGKTFANRLLIEAAIARGMALVLILDDKGPSAQYPGTVRANTAELKSRKPTGNEDPIRIVLRGHTLRTGRVCTPDEIAHVVLNELRADRVLVSIDELRRAATPAGREWVGKQIPRMFSEGGGLGVSITWTTQSPQRIPLEAFDQTETIGIFRSRARAVHYLADQLLLDDDLLDVLPYLQVGQFVLFRKSEPWDGRIYRF